MISNPQVLIFTITGVVAIISGAAHLYSRIMGHSREIKAIWKKHYEDCNAIKDHHKETLATVFKEIDELKSTTADVNTRLLNEISSIGKALSRIEGWIEGQK